MGISILHRIRSGATQETPAVAAEHAATRAVLSLDGTWQFRTDSSAPWRQIHVPGCWESQFEDLRGWAGSATYERTFAVPRSFHGKRVLLHFDAVDYYTEVWVNDRSVGKHEGGYTPFAFDVAEALNWDGENTLTVRVTDCTPEADVPLPDGSGILSFAEIPHGKQSWYTPVSGIWQSVELEARAFVSIERAALIPNVDDGTVRVELAISQAAASEGEWTAVLKFDPPAGAGTIADLVLRVPTGAAEARATVSVPDALLWSPEQPNLYVVTVLLKQGEEINDVFHTRFGMRKIETREGHVWLNNEPYFLIGALDQAFYPKTIYTEPSDQYLREQFLMAKYMGLNLMRCHIKVPSTSYLDLCDELGLLVWYEVPNGMILSQAMRRRVCTTFEEMLARDGNHPCIVIKSIMNESWGIDLGDPEQREWLVDTYRWAKKMAPDKLIVDNSACIPNFHVISDLDDYHVYNNVPDQAEDFAEWLRTFADRDAGSYSGFGDATRQRTEPLLISEFGNWGLPNYDEVLAAEGGRPWWFDTGAGITQPAGVLGRFDKQRLGRAFEDFNALARSSQEQEWIALKYQIEEMRCHTEVAGYVITEFTDINWEVNGLLDMGRHPKVFYDRLRHIQGQDVVIPRAERHAYWTGEMVRLRLHLSLFSPMRTDGAEIVWHCGGQTGRVPVGVAPRAATSDIGVIEFAAPDQGRPGIVTVDVDLRDGDGTTIAQATESIAVAPSEHQRSGEGGTVWIHDPSGQTPGLRERMELAGYRVVDAPEPDALGVVTYWDSEARDFVQGGGQAILVALYPKALQITSGLGVRLQERSMNNWWGDWCSSQTWFIPSEFPLLPDTSRFGFEYESVMPKRVLSGATADNVTSGIFVGWLHNPAAYVVRLVVGRGRLVATTFDVLTDYHADPVATLMFACLARQAGRYGI